MVAVRAGNKATYKYAHKLFQPQAQISAIPREQLLARIFDERAAPIVLVQGPAGHGKSTLLQQAMAECRERGMAVGWLTADEADNDLRRLSMHLQALLSGMSSGKTSARAAARASEELGSRADDVVARLLEIKTPVALFLDDFQSLTHRSVLSFFRDLLDHLPTHVRIFIGSRSVPDIGLARQVVNNQALVLRAEELRFSPLEVRRFFASAQDLEIREDELESIYRQTEGWPAALQLFRLSLASPNVRRSLAQLRAHRPRELADYLADNVLALQTPEVQDFLLRTSPLKRLSGPLCDKVLGRKDSQSILLKLEKSGLFMRSLDPGQHWFAYHALFADFLEEQLRAEAPEHLRETHARAASWFRQHGALEDAIQHAVAAGDHALAADVLDEWSSRLIALGHLVTVESWYEALPLDEIAKRPDLVVKVAWALCFLRRQQKLKPVIAMLKRLRGKPGRETQPDIMASMLALLDDDIPLCRDIIQSIEIRGQDLTGFPAFEFGAAANLRGYLSLAAGELENARQDLVLARAYGDRAEAGFSLGYTISMHSMYQLVQGRLNEALERLRQGLTLPWMRLEDSVSSAVISACYVQALYESGDLDAAEAQFEQGRESIAQFALLDYAAVAFTAMSRIHELRGRPAQALETLDEADSIGHTRSWPRLVHEMGWERVRRLLLRGELDRALAAVSRIVPLETPLPDGWIMYSEEIEGDLIGRARLDIHRGVPDAALGALAPALREAAQQGRVRRQIKLRVLEALAYRARDDLNLAQFSLVEALDLAEPDGLLRCIIDEGAAVIELLRRVRETQPAAGAREARVKKRLAFVERLLEAAGDKAGAEPATDYALLEPVTEREKKILALLANGATNEEIANQMFVSRNTVKFHLKNIYSKLSVNSRLQAINAARAMRMIP